MNIKEVRKLLDAELASRPSQDLRIRMGGALYHELHSTGGIKTIGFPVKGTKGVISVPFPSYKQYMVIPMPEMESDTFAIEEF